jgi:hypothetical protein
MLFEDVLTMGFLRNISNFSLIKSFALLGLSLGAGLTIALPAQAELYDLCYENESTYFIGETTNYWISICGGDAPYTYVGMNKNNNSLWIRADLVDYAQDGSWFEAANGDVSYSIDLYTAKGSFLNVTNGNGATILHEYLLDWQ